MVRLMKFQCFATSINGITVFEVALIMIMTRTTGATMGTLVIMMMMIIISTTTTMQDANSHAKVSNLIVPLPTITSTFGTISQYETDRTGSSRGI